MDWDELSNIQFYPQLITYTSFSLLGVAFAVIIPEGVLALIKAYTLRSHHHIQQRSDIDSNAVVDGRICSFKMIFYGKHVYKTIFLDI